MVIAGIVGVTVTFVTIINRKKERAIIYCNNKLFSTVTFVTIINRKKKRDLLYLNNNYKKALATTTLPSGCYHL